jgi:integrase
MKIRMRDGSGQADLKFIEEDVDRHGNVRVYFRRGGRKTRIREKPGTDEFMRVYRRLVANGHPEKDPGKGVAAPESLRWLMEQYMASPEFKTLSRRTRYVRRGLLDAISEESFGAQKTPHGRKPYQMMETRHVRKIRDVKGADLPEAANNRIKALRQLFAWAIEVDLAKNNPARDIKYLKGKPGGFHTWTEDEVSAFEDRHPVGTMARLALALLLYTGVRRSDVVRLGPQMEKDGWLKFTETKGRERLRKEREIPILPELRRIIDATPSGHLSYLVTSRGNPYTHAYFGNWFRECCNKAGLKHCSAHGLRKAGATIIVERGGTEHQLMAIYGWESTKQAGVYTRKANRKKLVAEAMHLLGPEPNKNKSVPLSDNMQEGGTFRAKKPL